MKHARIAWAGDIHHAIEETDASEHTSRLRLDNGERLPLDAPGLVWLPPLPPTPAHRPRTVLALGLNYADHARELAFKPPEEPLAFVKGAGSLVGHRAHTVRPEGVAFMHYECELAVVIGRTTRHVAKEQALDCVAGYTIANDYAIRDHLENWYRPNLRVKNRDAATPLGPWLVDAADIHQRPGGVAALSLHTTVNGQTTQRGNTRDLVFDVPTLIAYFSSFMTLYAGDVILTGTPDGVVNCQAGDHIICTIDGLGALHNTLTAPRTTL